MNAPVSDARTVALHHALDEARHLLIDHVDHMIGELQNALTHVAASRVPLDSRLAEIALGELVEGDPDTRVRAVTVMTVTAEFFGFTVNELTGRRRGTNPLARTRQIAMYLCRELADLSLPAIGHEFNRDHTTAMHAVRKIRHEATRDPRTNTQVHDLTVLIKRRAAHDALLNARTRHTNHATPPRWTSHRDSPRHHRNTEARPPASQRVTPITKRKKG